MNQTKKDEDQDKDLEITMLKAKIQQQENVINQLRDIKPDVKAVKYQIKLLLNII